MNRVQRMQVILVVAVFLGGIQSGMTLSEIFQSTATWKKLIIPAIGCTCLICLLLFSIVRPDGFAGKKDRSSI